MGASVVVCEWTTAAKASTAAGWIFLSECIVISDFLPLRGNGDEKEGRVGQRTKDRKDCC